MPLVDRLCAVFRHLFRNTLRQERVERELSQELESYLEMLVEEKLAAGMSREEARRTARLEFGGLDQVKEHVRDVRRGAWLDQVLRDVRYGVRMLAKHPGFTTVAVLSLALGIGATSTIFSVLNAAVLRPLPFEEPDRLVHIRLVPWNRKS